MSLRINQNIDALNSYRNLSVTQGQMSKSLEKLSSGYRINRAADDAAGLAISEGLRSQVGGLKVAVRNTQDGVSVVQTAEGALAETHSILQRMRDLSVQASNDGGVNTDAKDNIQAEIGQLKSELDRIASTTKFNGTSLLDGNYNGSFQVGANKGETITVSVGAPNKGMDSVGLGVDGVDVTVAAANATGGTYTTKAAAGTNGVWTLAGSTDFTAVGITADPYKALNGTVSVGSKSLDLSNVDYGSATTGAAALTALNTKLTEVFGAGAVTAAATATGLTFTTASPAAGATATAVAATEMKFTAASGASEAINQIDTAIKTVSSTRANLGAVQNRFEHTINNLNVAVENLSASESRIRDTDMASEMMSFTRSQILSQAGTAMLAQANQAPQGVLSLLR